MRKLIIIIIGSMLASCGGLPRHAEVRSDAVATLGFHGIDAATDVYVDDKLVASITDDAASVPISSGTHNVRLTRGGNTLATRTVFVQSNSKKIIDLRQAN